MRMESSEYLNGVQAVLDKQPERKEHLSPEEALQRLVTVIHQLPPKEHWELIPEQYAQRRQVAQDWQQVRAYCAKKQGK